MATIQQGFLKRGSLKRGGLLLAALALLGLAGALMMKPAVPRERRAALEFPRYPREAELERQRQRSTLLLQQPVPQQPESSAPTSSDRAPLRAIPAPASDGPTGVRVDPLQVALAGAPLGLVVETAALKDSRLGRMLLACLTPQLAQGLAELEQRTGVKPLEQLDRLAIAGDLNDPVVILGGQVAGFDPSALGEGLSFEPHGEQALWAETNGQAAALWQDQLLLLGKPKPVQAVLDRLQGKANRAGQDLVGEAYGELYGTLTGRGASELLPRELRERFATATERVTLHVDAREDLLLVAEVYGAEPPLLSDLASSIGGALALGRLQAVRGDNPVLADLLDQSRVIPGDGSFQVEMALPLDTIAAQLGECASNVMNEGEAEP
ncbi:MAG: hypothetical protein RL685_3875 [Pseudomonadota bacterium]|jgi:hypothetical protein